MSLIKTIFSRQFLTTLILCGLLAIFVIPLTKNWRQRRSIDKEVAELEQQVAAYEHKNSSLKQMLDYMQSDAFVEYEARTKLNYKKPGESVAVIEGMPGAPSTSVTSGISFLDVPPPPPEPHDPKLLGNVGKWLEYFFKK